MSTNPWNMLLIEPCEWTCTRPAASWMRSMIGLSYLVLKSLKSFGPCRGETLYSWPSIEKKEPIFWDRRNLTCYITICICRSQRWWMISRSVMDISAKFSEPHSSVTKPPGLNPIPTSTMPFSPTSALAAKNDEISPETLGLGKDRYFSASSGESTKNVSCNPGCPLRLTRKNSAVSFWECAGSLHDAENHRIVLNVRINVVIWLELRTRPTHFQFCMSLKDC